MAEVKLNAERRDRLGKNKVNKIRKEEMIPGIVYKKGENNVPVQFANGEFEKVYKTAGTSTVIDIVVEGKDYAAIIKNVQRHPFKNLFMHVDFQSIRMDEVLKITVPITLEGRDDIRLQPSVLNQLLNEIEIECLPGDIPEHIAYNVSEMDFETPVYVKDLDIMNNDKVTVLHDEEALVAILSEPVEQAEEEEESEDVSAADVPTVGETEEKDEE